MSESEEAPLLENEVRPPGSFSGNVITFLVFKFLFQNFPAQTPQSANNSVITWARAFANRVGDSSANSDEPRRSQSVDGMIDQHQRFFFEKKELISNFNFSSRHTRNRTISDRSYESTGDLVDVVVAPVETSTPVTTVATITSNASVGKIRVI